MKNLKLLCVSCVAGVILTASIPKAPAPIVGVAEENWRRIDIVSAETGIPRDHVKITSWRPDTCECEMEFAWDLATLNTPETRKHFPISVKACPLHGGRKLSGVKAASATFNSVLAENQQKNQLVGALSVQSGVPAEKIQWKVDAQRNFTASLPNRSTSNVATAK